MVVDPFKMGVTFGHQTGFVRSIVPLEWCFILYTHLHPIGSLPSMVGFQSSKFSGHGLLPVGAFGSFCISVRFAIKD